MWKNLTKLKNKNIVIKNKFLLQFIEKIASSLNKDLKKKFFFDLPNNELIFYIKKNINDLFNLKTCEFDKKISLLYLPFYFCLVIFYTIFIFIFKKKLFETKKYQVLFDNIETQTEMDLYNEFYKFYDKKRIIYRTTNKSFYKQQNVIFQPRYKGYSITFNDCLKIFNLLFFSIYISFKHNFNFCYFLIKIIDNIFYYKTLFRSINANHLIMHQYYMSNNIKNFYFKLNHGLKVSLIQKNILSMHTMGFFFDADNFFCLGSNTTPNKKKTKSRISKNLIVGSFFMHANKKKVNLKNKKKLDVLYVAGNGFHPDGQLDTYKEHNKDYMLHINWLIKIKKELPNLSIGFKHHSNSIDSFELNLLKDSGVIIFPKYKNSYSLCMNANMICSWASTMILEMKPLNFYSFFLDPGFNNSQFFHFLKNSKKIRIHKYEKFKNLVLNSISTKKNSLIDKEFCYDYKKVVKKIVNYLD
jgi:hypothetical protein